VSLFPTLKRAQLYGGLALLQMGFDEQDSQNLARYVYRSPLSLGSSARASIRLAEGLDNPEMPVYAVRSGAAALGIPLAQPHAEEVPFLPTAASPVRANIDASTSAALVQFVPKNYPAAPPTPSCLSKNLISGFLCAGESLDAHAQRAAFFTSALGGVPAIFSP
jgi:hypothetical protein